MIYCSLEILHHLTCDNCNFWWSFASSEKDFRLKKMTCPHCGQPDKVLYDPIYETKG